MKRVAPFHYLAGRFVVLHHTFEPQDAATETEPKPDSRGTDHWDLMFSTGETLLTYAASGLPEHVSPDKPASMRVLRLPDHRLHYLQYEGPISGNRGSVRRWASGLFRCDDSSRVVLESENLLAEMSIPSMDIGESQEILVCQWWHVRR